MIELYTVGILTGIPIGLIVSVLMEYIVKRKFNKITYNEKEINKTVRNR